MSIQDQIFVPVNRATLAGTLRVLEGVTTEQIATCPAYVGAIMAEAAVLLRLLSGIGATDGE